MTVTSKRSRLSSREKKKLLNQLSQTDLSEIQAELKRRAAKRSLAEFVKQAWNELEPDKPYVHNWHIDAICMHLEAVGRNTSSPEGIKRLLVNIPPGHMKSLIVNVFWFAWMWLHNPAWKAIYTTYSDALGVRDSMKCRLLLSSEWYKSFKPDWEFRPDQNQKSFFYNSHGGFRITLTVGGANTGFRGDVVVVDDPISVRDAESARARHEVVEWWDTAMSSRLNDMRHGAFVIIMQRLHEEDLSGHVLSKRGTDHSKGGYDHICLPSEYEGPRRPTSLGWKDPRKTPGELLFPELFPAPVIAEAKINLGPRYSGQHQQDPVPADGNIFKPRWFGYWVPADRPELMHTLVQVRVEDELYTCPMRLLPWTTQELRDSPGLFSVTAQSWDLTFGSKSQAASYVSGQLWASIGSQHFLLDQVRERLDMPGSIEAIKAMTERWPHVVGKLIEAKANGPAVMQTLRGNVGGMLPVMPYGSKPARAQAVAPLFASGDVFFPHPHLYSWVTPTVSRFTAFPAAASDEVDTASQYLQWASGQIQQLQTPPTEDRAAHAAASITLDML